MPRRSQIHGVLTGSRGPVTRQGSMRNGISAAVYYREAGLKVEIAPPDWTGLERGRIWYCPQGRPEVLLYEGGLHQIFEFIQPHSDSNPVCPTIQQYRTILNWYAQPGIYKKAGFQQPSRIREDHGERARQILAGHFIPAPEVPHAAPV